MHTTHSFIVSQIFFMENQKINITHCYFFTHRIRVFRKKDLNYVRKWNDWSTLFPQSSVNESEETFFGILKCMVVF